MSENTVNAALRRMGLHGRELARTQFDRQQLADRWVDWVTGVTGSIGTAGTTGTVRP